MGREKAAHAEFHRQQNHAAKAIQASYRARTGRQEAARVGFYRQQNRAATMIQAGHRGRMGRREHAAAATALYEEEHFESDDEGEYEDEEYYSSDSHSQ